MHLMIGLIHLIKPIYTLLFLMRTSFGTQNLSLSTYLKIQPFFTSYGVNRVNDSVMHIPRGLPISNSDSIYFTGLSLGELNDTVQALAPRFEYTIQTGGGQSNNNNINSKKSIGVGYPTIVYEDKMSFPLNSDVYKYFPDYCSGVLCTSIWET